MGGRGTPISAERPSLEFQHVFDLCAVEARRVGGTGVVVSGGHFYGPELKRRLEGLEVVEGIEDGCGWAVWAPPAGEDGAVVAAALRGALVPGARLYVVAAGLTAAALPEWERREVRLARLWRVKRWLRRAGLRVERVYGFHGPLSAAWGYLSRPLERLGRPDLADRALFRMRADYATEGWRVAFAPLAVVVARSE